MRWQNWRRSDNVEDYTDPKKPVGGIGMAVSCFMTLAEMVGLTQSKLAKDLGREDVPQKKRDT